MLPSIEERVAYGRSIRQRALCFLDAHGTYAEAEALNAALEPGIGEAERCFMEAVAGRVARMLAHSTAVHPDLGGVRAA
jgi:hypothetical protein